MLNDDPNMKNSPHSDSKRLCQGWVVDSDECFGWPAPALMASSLGGGGHVKGHGEQVHEACSIKETFRAWEVKGFHRSRIQGQYVQIRSHVVAQASAIPISPVPGARPRRKLQQSWFSSRLRGSGFCRGLKMREGANTHHEGGRA